MTTIAPVDPKVSCKAQLVQDFLETSDRKVWAGHFSYCDGYDGTKDVAMLFGCPCGCGSLHSIALKPYPAAAPDDRSIWQWDGNRETPTLTPSILSHQLDSAGNKIGEHWHGFLTAGEFESC